MPACCRFRRRRQPSAPPPRGPAGPRPGRTAALHEGPARGGPCRAASPAARPDDRRSARPPRWARPDEGAASPPSRSAREGRSSVRRRPPPGCPRRPGSGAGCAALDDAPLPSHELPRGLRNSGSSRRGSRPAAAWRRAAGSRASSAGRGTTRKPFAMVARTRSVLALARCSPPRGSRRRSRSGPARARGVPQAPGLDPSPHPDHLTAPTPAPSRSSPRAAARFQKVRAFAAPGPWTVDAA